MKRGIGEEMKRKWYDVQLFHTFHLKRERDLLLFGQL